MADRIVLMLSHGPEDPERATIPLSTAVAAQASEVEVLLGFQSNEVSLLKNGNIDHVFAPGFPPLKQLFDVYREAGGKFLACAPCVQSRSLNQEDLIPGTQIVSGATFVKEFTASSHVLVY